MARNSHPSGIILLLSDPQRRPQPHSQPRNAEAQEPPHRMARSREPSRSSPRRCQAPIRLRGDHAIREYSRGEACHERVDRWRHLEPHFQLTASDLHGAFGNGQRPYRNVQSPIGCSYIHTHLSSNSVYNTTYTIVRRRSNLKRIRKGHPHFLAALDMSGPRQQDRPEEETSAGCVSCGKDSQ